MRIERLWLTDVRNYPHALVTPAADGLTVVVGANGEGKTNLLEAIAYLAKLRSFRGAPSEAMVRTGAESAVIRAEAEREGRSLLIEAEIRPGGRDRVQVNRQPLRRAGDLTGALQVTVFTPDDLQLVKGGPAERRQYLDDLLVALHPRHDATQTELERILKQRNALLKSAGSSGSGRSDHLDTSVTTTLDVWDAKLAEAGETLVLAREALSEALGPLCEAAYDRLAGAIPIRLTYRRSWAGSLAEALAAARRDDLRRGVTSIGPHRDELELTVGGLTARTHASQGEQRTLALALRLAGHHLVTGRIGSAPMLLLDDVFSELDANRSAALLSALPPGQTLVTTAGSLPAGMRPSMVLCVSGGTLTDVAGRLSA